MQSLNSLYFPETVLPHHLRNTLLLLPDTLHFLQPVEGENFTANDPFMEKGICQAHTPSPLGKDKDRFLALIREIQEQKSTNAEQFSQQTLAHLSEELQQGDQNHRSIMANLVSGKTRNTPEKNAEQQKANLWQARLVLVLAEILDLEEAELAEKFSDIDATELDLFQELRGEFDASTNDETDNPFAEVERIRAKLNQQRPGTIKRRFRSWKTFYASGDLPENFWLWITAIEEAGELLISNYEERSGRISVPLLRLNLPEQMQMREADAIEAILQFHEQSKEVRQEINEKLSTIVKQSHLDLVDPVALLPDAGVLARDWNDLIEYHFPEKHFGRKKLDLQFLANISLDQLVHSGTDTPSSALCHGIVGLCRE
jgi:hypothetical protein